MPHIIVEYSANLDGDLHVDALLGKLHQQLATHESVNIARIKTRAVKLDHFIVGDKGESGEMIHTTLLLLEGRTDATKKEIGEPLLAIVKTHVADTHPQCSASLEIRDMSAAAYFV